MIIELFAVDFKFKKMVLKNKVTFHNNIAGWNVSQKSGKRGEV